MYATLGGRGPGADAKQAAGLGVLVAPDSLAKNVMPPPGVRICLDNGAYHAHSTQTPWDWWGFASMAERYGHRADFVITPDVVGQRDASLRRTFEWLNFCTNVCHRVLFSVQDGMTVDDVKRHLSPRVGIFVGGSVEWKVSTIGYWGAVGRQFGVWVHVGKVNTQERINRCQAASITSADGTSATRFPIVNSPKIRRWLDTPVLPLGEFHGNRSR